MMLSPPRFRRRGASSIATTAVFEDEVLSVQDDDGTDLHAGTSISSSSGNNSICDDDTEGDDKGSLSRDASESRRQQDNNNNVVATPISPTSSLYPVVTDLSAFEYGCCGSDVVGSILEDLSPLTTTVTTLLDNVTAPPTHEDSSLLLQQTEPQYSNALNNPPPPPPPQHSPPRTTIKLPNTTRCVKGIPPLPSMTSARRCRSCEDSSSSSSSLSPPTVHKSSLRQKPPLSSSPPTTSRHHSRRQRHSRLYHHSHRRVWSEGGLPVLEESTCESSSMSSLPMVQHTTTNVTTDDATINTDDNNDRSITETKYADESDETSTIGSRTDVTDAVSSSNSNNSSTPSGRSFDELYVLTRLICQNEASSIWECVYRATGINYAVKILERGPDADHEAAILQRVQSTTAAHHHANILRLHEVVMDAQKVYLITTGLRSNTPTNLTSLVVQADCLDEATVQSLALDMVQTIQYLDTTHHVVHNAWHPGNVLLSNEGDDDDEDDRSVTRSRSRAVLCDFGAAVTAQAATNDDSPSTSVGSSSTTTKASRNGPSSYYRAPELETLTTSPSTPSTAADMWSIGVILHFCLFGACDPGSDAVFHHIHGGGGPPIQSQQHAAAPTVGDSSIDSNRTLHFSWNRYSRQCKQFLANLVCRDPTVRLTPSEALAHPWLATLAADRIEACASDSDIRGSSSSNNTSRIDRRQGHRRTVSSSSLLTRINTTTTSKHRGKTARHHRRRVTFGSFARMVPGFKSRGATATHTATTTPLSHCSSNDHHHIHSCHNSVASSSSSTSSTQIHI